MQASCEILGSGGSHGIPVIGCECDVCKSTNPKDARMRPSILIRLENTENILVDCGPEFRLQALRSKIETISALLVTHVHADHIFGMDDLRVFTQSGGCLPVFSTEMWTKDIHNRFKYIFGGAIQKGGGLPQVRLIPIEDEFEVCDVKVTPIPLNHGATMSCGFRFGNLAYLTDCDVIPEESYALLDGVELLVINGVSPTAKKSHMNFSAALSAIERIGAQQAWFTHISHKCTHDEIQAYIDAEIEKRPGLQGRCIHPAYDGMVISGIVIPT